MTQSRESHLAELHTKAAYAHAAAAHLHSTGDHASAQELARKPVAAGQRFRFGLGSGSGRARDQLTRLFQPN
jgi:hypothetical protein